MCFYIKNFIINDVQFWSFFLIIWVLSFYVLYNSAYRNNYIIITQWLLGMHRQKTVLWLHAALMLSFGGPSLCSPKTIHLPLKATPLRTANKAAQPSYVDWNSILHSIHVLLTLLWIKAWTCSTSQTTGSNRILQDAQAWEWGYGHDMLCESAQHF